MSTTNPQTIYLIVSGAGAARFTPHLLQLLPSFGLPIYTFLTEGARRIISPAELAALPGHRLVDNYFDPILINGRAPGLTMVIPATFNTLNKISQGIADSLPHSLAAEAIGAGWPVIIAPAMNQALANHPQAKQSRQTLRQWGVRLLEAEPGGDIAPLETIVAAVKTAIATSGSQTEFGNQI